MMSMVLFMVFWGIMVFKSRLNFWFSMFIASLYYVLMLSNSPLYFGLNFLGYECMIDTLSFSLLALSIWLLMLMVLCSFKILKEGVKELYFIFLMVVLLLMLVLTFVSSNYIGLYLFFEASLIPTLLVITGWGYQTERLQAGIYFLFYTVVSSLPLLLIFLSFYNESGSLSLYFSFGEGLFGGNNSILNFFKFLALVSAFLVKMPLFFVHLWLPSAHVEAPVAGSMILAGVLLKLGGYGLCRVMFGLTGTMNVFSNWMVSLGLVSMSVVGFMCCRLNDMKALVAYSSIAHMGLVVAGLYIGSVLGYTGSLVMMLGHGVASSGLFSILNMYYERTGSRSFFLNSGMILILPTFSLFMFLLCASNMGAPPTMNLLSELYLLGSLMSFDWLMIYVLPLGSFMGVVFTMFLYSYSQHGKFNMSMSGYMNVNMVELNSLMLHVVPLNILVLKFDLFMLWL